MGFGDRRDRAGGNLDRGWQIRSSHLHPTRSREPGAKSSVLCRKLCYRYANGVVVRLKNGPAGAPSSGERLGTMTIDRGRYVVEPPDLVEQPEGKGPARIDVHMQNWLDCIRSRQRPAADVEIGHRTATICHLVNIARELGQPLRWDPDQRAVHRRSGGQRPAGSSSPCTSYSSGKRFDTREKHFPAAENRLGHLFVLLWDRRLAVETIAPSGKQQLRDGGLGRRR